MTDPGPTEPQWLTGLARCEVLTSGPTPRRMVETLIAAFVLVLCAALLLRLALGPARRARLDHFLRRTWKRPRSRWTGWRRRRAHRKDADRLTRELIARARRPDPHEERGQVIRPEAFQRPRKPH